jgi:hypothetical protein
MMFHVPQRVVVRVSEDMERRGVFLALDIPYFDIFVLLYREEGLVKRPKLSN